MITQHRFLKTASWLAILSMHILSIYSLILSPENPPRVFFGPALFLLLLVIGPVQDFLHHLPKLSLFSWAKAGLTVVFLLQFLFVFADIHTSYQQVRTQYHIIQEAKAAGQTNATIDRLTPALTLYNAYKRTANLGEGNTYWFNQWMAAYFQIETITGQEP